MKIELIRDTFTQECVTGRIMVDGQLECYCLEPPQRDVKPHCIPEGNYEVKFNPPGPHLAHIFPEYGLFPEVLNVPDFEGIFIHPGNFPRDTQGCILPGRPRGDNYVAHSKVVFEWLCLLLREATDGISLVIRKA